jgi:predicted metal-dependent hydrolase
VGETSRGVMGGLELFVARESTSFTDAASYHNLKAISAEIEREYFADRKHTSPRIQWGKSIGRKKRHSIRLGSYYRPSAVIRIHPRLNSADVPQFFVKSIIYHEYLHHVLGPNHNRRFRRIEHKFRYYREAREWLRRYLPILLGHRATPLPPPPIVPRNARRAVQMFLFG